MTYWECPQCHTRYESSSDSVIAEDDQAGYRMLDCWAAHTARYLSEETD